MVTRPGQGEGHDQRRGHEEVGLDVLMDARLKIAVAGKDGGGDDVILDDGLLHGRGQRAGVADASGAAVTDEVEAEKVEEGLQAGFSQIIGDDAGTGGERGLDERMGLQSLFHGFFGEQTGGQHDGRIARVGATGDGGNQNVAVVNLAAAGRGGAVSRNGKGARQIPGRFAKAVFGGGLGKGLGEFLFHRGQFNSVLRPFRTGHTGAHAGEVQFQVVE